MILRQLGETDTTSNSTSLWHKQTKVTHIAWCSGIQHDICLPLFQFQPYSHSEATSNRNTAGANGCDKAAQQYKKILFSSFRSTGWMGGWEDSRRKSTHSMLKQWTSGILHPHVHRQRWHVAINKRCRPTPLWESWGAQQPRGLWKTKSSK